MRMLGRTIRPSRVREARVRLRGWFREKLAYIPIQRRRLTRRRLAAMSHEERMLIFRRMGLVDRDGAPGPTRGHPVDRPDLSC